jgi:hypothetical protein
MLHWLQRRLSGSHLATLHWDVEYVSHPRILSMTLNRSQAGYARLQGITNGDDRAPINSVGIPPSKQEFCKGYQRRGLGGKSPKKLSPGENQFDLDSNMAAHNGGSMQVSLSFDDAKTFKARPSLTEDPEIYSLTDII